MSHDRYFINKTATRILELTQQQFINYIGNYDYYLEKKEVLTPISDTAATTKTQAPSAQKLDWKQQKEAQAILRKRENDLKNVKTK